VPCMLVSADSTRLRHACGKEANGQISLSRSPPPLFLVCAADNGLGVFLFSILLYP
jgi:hypothetical protein